MLGELGSLRQRLRILLSEQLGGGSKASDFAILESTTAGLNGAASSIKLNQGDNVVLSAIDYLAVATPWKHRERRDGIELRYAPSSDGRITVDALLDQIDERTRVVCVSTIAWTTGALTDIEALSRETRTRGILLILDAIQTFGVIPLDLARVGASFIAVGGHKWLCSPMGAGFLYVNPLTAARHQPPYLGFLSGQPEVGTWAQFFESKDASAQSQVRFPASGRSFEVGGTANYPGAIGLLTMMELLGNAKVGSVATLVRALGDILIEGLDRLGYPLVTPRASGERAGIIVVHVGRAGEGDAETVLALKAKGIVVSLRHSAGYGGIRVSLHGMNTEEDVARLLAALSDLKK
jgi:selenocysteine lyase/cysteine desulfurase